jgi:coatomer subunit beta
MTSEDAPCTLIVHFEGASPPTKELKEAIEKGDIQTKIDTLKTLIKLQLNGEPQSHFIMTVIKHCVPVDNHILRKLCIYFWESVDKTGDDGKPLPEIILLCSFLRNDLQHPNEYVRGNTLRFLSKVRERDILENLISAMVPNLTHADAYVRRNAVLAVHATYTRFPNLIPDAPEFVEKLMLSEKDVSTRRHALNMLFGCAQERAVRVLASFRESNDEGEALQLCIVDTARQLIAAHPYDRGMYLPFVMSALHSKSPSVLYQCACTLLNIASSPTAISSATATLTQLLSTHSDSNAKLIVLDRLVEMKGRYLRTLQDNLMDILRSLNSAGAELRRRIVDFAVDLVCSRNIEAFTVAMKKELVRSQTDDIGDSDAQQEYRQQLVRAIHTAVIKHLDLAPTVVPIMLDYVCESGASSYQVIQFLREVAFARPEMQDLIFERLVMMLPMVASSQVLRTVLWLFTALCKTPEHIAALSQSVKEALAPLPLAPEVRDHEDRGGPSTISTTVVREDGTYVTNVVLVDKKKEVERTDLIGLRAMLVSGDWFLGSALGHTLAKLVVRMHLTHGHHAARNQVQDDAIDVINAIVTYGNGSLAPAPLDADNHERLVTALTVIRNPKNETLSTLVSDSIDAFEKVRAFAAAKRREGDEDVSDGAGEVVLGDVDQPMVFTQLTRGKQALFEFEATKDDIQSALANAEERPADFVATLNRVVQLSGFSDPIYAEATVHVHQFDIAIDLYAVNQTDQQLDNVTIEFGATGDLKLCERPQTYMMPPGAALTCKLNIKVTSTEKGVIFGSILYDTASSESNCVILNEVTIDILEYIREGTCTASEFRELWTSFEWENKISVPPCDLTPRDFLQRLRDATRLTPIEPIGDDDGDYLCALLYAKSTFAEDVLANVAMERTDKGKLEAVVRVRAKTQGIALGLGDKIESIPKALAARK